jgi:hydrogenase maturation protease
MQRGIPAGNFLSPLKTERILVAALGNPMAGDDAFGPLVARQLIELDRPSLQVVDLSWENPSALLDHLEGPSGLIIIDAVAAPGMTPGEVVDVDWHAEGRPTLLHESALSTHGLSVANQMELADSLHLLPERVRLIGVVVAKTQLGAGISSALAPAVAQAVQHVLFWSERWRGGVRC